MTTVGTLKNYRYDLNRSNNTLGKAMNTVTSRRMFNSYGEDPALATRCFQIRHAYWRAESQYTVNESLRHKYDVAWQAMGTVSTDLYALAEDTSLTSIVRGASDPTGPGRMALGQSLVSKAKDMAQTMNGRYGENFVFAGADTLNEPFTWGPRTNPTYIPGTADPGKPDPTNKDHAAAFKYEADKALAPKLFTDDPNEAAKVEQLNPYYNEGYTMNATTPEDKEDPRYGKYLDKNGKGTEDQTKANLVPKENKAYDPNATFKYLKPDGTGTNNKEEAAQGLYYRGVSVDSDHAS